MTLDLDTSLTYCTYCPKLCRHVCPVSSAEGRETVTPQTKMATMRLLRGRTAIEATVEVAASLYACTGCGACTEACHHDITPGRHLFTGRAEAERAGLGAPALATLPERVRAKAQRAALTTRELVAPQRFTAAGETAYLPGCDDPAGAVTALALADRLGLPLDVPEGTPGCAGYPLLAGGFDDAFRLHAETVARSLAGFRRVAVACPSCAWAMKVEYPAHGVPLAPEVVHPTELFAEALQKIPVGEARGEAFYHDPCYLARWLGVTEEPRQLLQRVGVSVREFSRSRAEGVCCGGGGVLPLTAPATADAIAAWRLDEVREAGVGSVITACPTCRRRLESDGVASRSLIDVLEEATRTA